MRRISAAILLSFCGIIACAAGPMIQTPMTVLNLNTGNSFDFTNGTKIKEGYTFQVKATANNQTQSLRFQVDNQGWQPPDNVTPYYSTKFSLPAGGHTFRAVPYPKDNGQGIAGPTVTVNFNVVAVTPSPTPSPTATPSPSPSPSATPSPTETPTPTASPSPTISPSPSASPAGIAARYPGDKNIELDPDVLLFDDFEGYTSTAELTSKWTDTDGIKRMQIATAPGTFFAGKQAIEMSIPVTPSELNDALNKTISPQQDTLFIRAYCKFEALYFFPTGNNHNGLLLSAHYPGAGIKAPSDGTGFFDFLVQNANEGLAGDSTPGFTHLYAYWPKQRTNFGDHWYPTGIVVPSSGTIGNKGEWLAYPNQYPDFKPMPNFIPQRDKWYCYELMVKANTIGQNDGEVKVWIDGNVVADFPDLFLRSISTLKIDRAVVYLHAGQSNRLNKKWYDNVVIATKYIGPMAPVKTVSVTVEWTPTTGDSYQLYYGTASGQYLSPVPAGTTGSFRLDGLAPATNYYFALTALRNGIESGKSPEVSYTTTLQLKQKLKLNRKSRTMRK